MHEYSIARALVGRVERELARRPGAIVRRLEVRIGELAGVEIALLHTAYEALRARTVCDAAELAISAVPAVWRCPRCDRAIADGGVLRCCGGPAELVPGGDDIMLERIELEVRDV
jgi:hydrogenase nickel incorporation protein HypA/HybF